jgi:hypothetical protein
VEQVLIRTGKGNNRCQQKNPKYRPETNLKEKKGETALALEKLTAREITRWFEVITLRIEK